MSKPVCLVTAPVATRSGYGAHSRDIVRALVKLDKYDVKIWNVRWGNCSMNALNKDDPNADNEGDKTKGIPPNVQCKYKKGGKKKRSKKTQRKRKRKHRASSRH